LKLRITFFFSIIFIASIAIPTVVGLTNKNSAVSVFFDLNEMEHEKENSEETNLKEIKIYTSYFTNDSKTNVEKEKCMSFYIKNYISQYPKVRTQPPEHLL
jgi:pyridoxine 5'-phosphate synthase PdxJ